MMFSRSKMILYD